MSKTINSNKSEKQKDEEKGIPVIFYFPIAFGILSLGLGTISLLVEFFM